VVATRRERDERAKVWHAALLTRPDMKFPAYRDFVGVGPQTSEEQAAVWRHAAKVFGFKVKKHNKRKSRIVRFPAKEARG
jgi:hypothetical protein